MDLWAPDSPLRNALGATGLASALTLLALVPLVGLPLSCPRVASDTLAPAFEMGDRPLVLHWPRFGWEPAHGDIIVFSAPPSTGEREGQPFIKRVVGLPGQTVEVRDGVLRLDGRQVEEPWRNLKDGPGPDQAPLEVPSGELYVLGDNRGLSYDSRYWGTLSRDQVSGIVLE